VESQKVELPQKMVLGGRQYKADAEFQVRYLCIGVAKPEKTGITGTTGPLLVQVGLFGDVAQIVAKRIDHSEHWFVHWRLTRVVAKRIDHSDHLRVPELQLQHLHHCCVFFMR
jgi:hypothetical protein